MPVISEDLLRRVAAQVNEDLRAELEALLPGNGRAGLLIEVPFHLAPYYAGALHVGANAAMMSHDPHEVKDRLRADARRCEALLPEVFSKLVHRGDAKDIITMMHAGPVSFEKDSLWRDDGDFKITGTGRPKHIFVKRGENTTEIIAALETLALELCPMADPPFQSEGVEP